MADNKQDRKPAKGADRKANRRGAARLAAVQALYQMEIGGAGINDTFAEFESHWLGSEVEGDFDVGLIAGELHPVAVEDPSARAGHPLFRRRCHRLFLDVLLLVFNLEEPETIEQNKAAAGDDQSEQEQAEALAVHDIFQRR